MSAPFETLPVAVPYGSDELRKARENAYANLGFVQHYAGLMRGFLEVDDDGGAIYSYQHLREYLKSAVRNFEPCRAAFGHRVAKTQGARDA